MQDLNDMLYFAEVAERGGFAAAGRALGMPKSRLSRRISELESRLGVRLLQRTTRKLSLTEVGEIYLRHCSGLRDQAHAAGEAVEQMQAAPRGTVRVACPVTLAQNAVGRLIPLYMAQHPQVKIDLRVTNRVVDLVEEGIDVALRVRLDLDESGSLVVKNLGASSGFLVASPLQIQRQGQPASLAELGRLDTVAMSSQDGKSSWKLIDPQGNEVLFKHEPRYVADDLQTLKLAILAGTGFSFLPADLAAAELEAGSLVQLLPDWTRRSGKVHAVFPSRRGQVPAVRSFLDFMGDHLRGLELVE
jgi:DNA-binding transcriptional LysR family regulator